MIPARGGSTRIPGKNVRLLHGRPLLAYTVEAALESGCFQNVIVSTDDSEIATIARAAGAEVPFLRGAPISDNHVPVSAVALDALERLDPDGRAFALVALLLPTCPLRTADDVRRSLEHFVERGAGLQISVTRFGSLSPWWAMQRSDDGTLDPVFPDALKRRSQDLPTLYAPTGAIWWATTEALRRSGTFHGDGVVGFELDWRHAVDIDDEEDFELARVLLSLRSESKVDAYA